MTKPIVELYGHAGTGLIIQHPTGVIYTNQAGGHCCLQAELEGAFVPIGNDYATENREFLSPEHELLACFQGPKHNGTGAIHGLDESDARLIDQTMKQVAGIFEVYVDRVRLSESVEAWVWVTISPTAGFIASGFGPVPWHGVLTWANSD